jgi:hypothetical protein
MNGQGTVTLFLSTGRCGTQWLAAALSEHYGDLAVVTHEPIDKRYQPKEFYRRWDAVGCIAAVPAIREHLARVDRITSRRDYIEVGWTGYAAVPYFIEKYPDRVRLVHLVRHPVPTAMSMATHRLYGDQRESNFAARIGVVDPYTPGVRLTDFATRWLSMNEYERCLFWWAELNLYAEDVNERYPDVPFLRVRYEDFFAPESMALDSLIAFLGFPNRPEFALARGERFDDYRFLSTEEFDWRRIEQFPLVLERLHKYGYTLTSVADAQLRRRYNAPEVWRAGGSGDRRQRHDVIGVVRRMSVVRRAGRRRGVRRVYHALRAATRLSAPARFVANELRGRQVQASYGSARLLGAIVVRHPDRDVGIVEDVLVRHMYKAPIGVRRVVEALPTGPRIVDLGAGTGVVSLYLLRTFPNATMCSFEPDRGARLALLRTIERNALGHRWAPIEPRAPRDANEEGDATERGSGKVDLVEMLSGADIVRVNVDGGEWHVLADERFLVDPPPVLIVNFDRRLTPAGISSDIRHVLEDAGYSTTFGIGRGDGSGALWAWLGRAALRRRETLAETADHPSQTFSQGSS